MRGFRVLVGVVAGDAVKDTQCGFKLFTRAAARVLFGNQRLQRWCFDVELVHLATSRLGSSSSSSSSGSDSEGAGEAAPGRRAGRGRGQLARDPREQGPGFFDPAHGLRDGRHLGRVWDGRLGGEGRGRAGGGGEGGFGVSGAGGEEKGGLKMRERLLLALFFHFLFPLPLFCLFSL